MKLTRSIATILLLASALTSGVHASEIPAVSAASYILMDAASGRTLASDHADEPRLIASTTKIMTALVALEHCDPDAEVEIESAWTGIEGSTMYLTAGQEMTVRDLLYGLMLASGNDAAVALACLTAGSVESFAEMMNERAAELGCVNTHFVNPNGLDDADHYSTARDLALIAREAIQNEEFRKIASSTSAEIDGYSFTNHNRLLRECEGVFGVKTGYTEAAGRTLVSCCERDGVTMICVTLNDPDDWADHAALYDWAFDNYVQEELSPLTSRDVSVIGGVWADVSVAAESETRFLHRFDDVIETRLYLPRFAFAPVREGARAGEAAVIINGEEAVTVPLLYRDSVEAESAKEQSFWNRLMFLRCLWERKTYALQ
jgi:D-alanyl-D-alanine carboxypeptidase (penicillin-binding protein 5/6)